MPQGFLRDRSARNGWEMAPSADYQQIMDFPETPGIVPSSSSNHGVHAEADDFHTHSARPMPHRPGRRSDQFPRALQGRES